MRSRLDVLQRLRYGRLPRSKVSGSNAVGAVGFVALGIGLSTLAAMASYHGFEQHFLKLKHRFPNGQLGV